MDPFGKTFLNNIGLNVTGYMEILPHHYVIRRSREIASASSAFNAWLAPCEEDCLYVCTNCNSLILRRTTGR